MSYCTDLARVFAVDGLRWAFYGSQSHTVVVNYQTKKLLHTLLLPATRPRTLLMSELARNDQGDEWTARTL
jgi:hypothetical protein